MRVTLCASCPLGLSGFPALLSDALKGELPGVVLDSVECMSGCSRPSTLAVRDTGKTAYLLGDLGTDDLQEILAFLRLYAVSQDGNFADARVLGKLRFKAIARIPA